MTNLRENILAKGLKDAFISVQKAKQVNKKIARWEENVMDLNEEEMEKKCKQIAHNVEIYCQEEEARGTLTREKERIKIIQELNNI